MKGVILAGGHGTRLYPLTGSTNKHLVPVGKLPMIEYPLHTLGNMNLEGLSVVTGGEHFSDVQKYLSTVHKSVNFTYYCQKEAGGLPDALKTARPMLEYVKIAVILGDNIFEEDFSEAAREFERSKLGAMVFLKEVPDSDLYSTDSKGVRRAKFGIAEVRNGKVVGVEEKPIHPKSNLSETGLYFFDSSVFDKIETLKPSARGELEITDVHRLYMQEGNLGYKVVRGFWGDAGTFRSREICQEFIREGLENRVIASLVSRENDDLLKKNLAEEDSVRF